MLGVSLGNDDSFSTPTPTGVDRSFFIFRQHGTFKMVVPLDDQDSVPLQRNFDSRLVYTKTALGGTEMLERQLNLSIGARRMLIIIDGQRRLGDLPTFARPGELGAVLEELESHRLIALAGIADAMPETERRARQKVEDAILGELKTQLAGVFTKELGESTGEVLEARMADAVNIEIAKRVLRDAIDVVGTRVNQEAANRVILAAKPILNRLV